MLLVYFNYLRSSSREVRTLVGNMEDLLNHADA
jgi:hypothetical protein